MKVELISSTVGSVEQRQFCLTTIIDDSIAIDAGTLGLLWPLQRQRNITNVFLTHSHIDHTAGLPVFLDNVYMPGPDCPTVRGTVETLEVVRANFFNEKVWPDLIRLSGEESPFLRMEAVSPGTPVEVDGVRVTPVELNHVVPTVGFVVQSGSSAVAFITDTSPTQRIWDVLAQIPRLKAVFLECCFPNRFRWLADKSGHLCPQLFEAEIAKLRKDVPVYAYHLKPAFFEELVSELEPMASRGVRIAELGRAYEF